MKATQAQYDNIMAHIRMKWFEDDSHFTADAYYEARIILTMLELEHGHLNEHMVDA